ncbi:MAG: cysteine desulfurase family protein [Bacillota bacterium]
MEKEIYLDNSATTKALPEVLETVTEMMTKNYGNPSSPHRMGLAAEQVVRQARQSVAEIIGAKPEEIFFCSGGTEANNWAIQGTIRQRRSKPSHIITSQVEHPSVLKTCQVLEQQGYQVTFLPVNPMGIVDPGDVEKAITPDTVLVSLMHVNNETGAIQPIPEVGEILRQHPNVVFHVDGVQSFGKLPLDIHRSGVHLFSVSGHKIHGPKGIGALYVRAGTRLTPLLWGGEQEGNLRAGTENVPGIAGLGTAAAIAGRHMADFSKVVGELRNSFKAKILARLDRVKVNSPMDSLGAPHILNLSFEGIKAEVLLRMLQDRGIFVSTGSACHSRRNRASHVLSALGLRKKHLEGALRFSFSLLNTEAEISLAAETVAEAVAELRSF